MKKVNLQRKKKATWWWIKCQSDWPLQRIRPHNRSPSLPNPEPVCPADQSQIELLLRHVHLNNMPGRGAAHLPCGFLLILSCDLRSRTIHWTLAIMQTSGSAAAGNEYRAHVLWGIGLASGKQHGRGGRDWSLVPRLGHLLSLSLVMCSALLVFLFLFLFRYLRLVYSLFFFLTGLIFSLHFIFSVLT